MALLPRKISVPAPRSFALFTLALSLLAGPAGAFTFIQIDVPGAAATLARGINRQGQIVGSYALPDDLVSHGFLLNQGVFTTIDVPGALDTRPYDLTGSGKIVGTYGVDGDPRTHGFLLARGIFAPIDVPGAIDTVPTDMNGRGQIVGVYVDANSVARGFLLHEDVFTAIDVPGATGTGARGINGRGQIVGVYCAVPRDAPLGEQASTCHGFLRDSDGAFTAIDVPGAEQTFATSINGRGHIVGFYEDAAGRFHGFLLKHGEFETIDVPGALDSLPRKIQGRRIVGEFRDANFRFHGFLAAP